MLMTLLLAWKMELQRFAGGLEPGDIRSAALLGPAFLADVRKREHRLSQLPVNARTLTYSLSRKPDTRLYSDNFHGRLTPSFKPYTLPAP
jgi:hypothetical protein